MRAGDWLAGRRWCCDIGQLGFSRGCGRSTCLCAQEGAGPCRRGRRSRRLLKFKPDSGPGPRHHRPGHRHGGESGNGCSEHGAPRAPHARRVVDDRPGHHRQCHWSPVGPDRMRLAVRGRSRASRLPATDRLARLRPANRHSHWSLDRGCHGDGLVPRVQQRRTDATDVANMSPGRPASAAPSRPVPSNPLPEHAGWSGTEADSSPASSSRDPRPFSIGVADPARAKEPALVAITRSGTVPFGALSPAGRRPKGPSSRSGSV